MGDLIKRGLFLAALGFTLWKGYRYWQGRDAVHQLVFKVDGPPACRVEIVHEAQGSPRTEQTTLAWESPAVTARGNAEAALTVNIPLACGWQPHQVSCSIERDGAAWKSAEARRVTNSANGDLASLRCELAARVTE